MDGKVSEGEMEYLDNASLGLVSCKWECLAGPH